MKKIEMNERNKKYLMELIEEFALDFQHYEFISSKVNYIDETIKYKLNINFEICNYGLTAHCTEINAFKLKS